MAIEKLIKVTYHDFKLNEIIDPEKFDQNNKDLVEKIDEIVDIINSQETDLEEINIEIDEAIDTANEAKELVEQANTKANEAIDTSVEAKELAEQANTKANESINTANEAINTAVEAKELAEQANTKADEAVNTANGIESIAIEAKTIAQTTESKLQTTRTITLSGDVSGSTSFDGLSNITINATVADDSHNHVISNIDNLQTTLDSKAPLASPAFTGTPTAPTAPSGTNTNQIATTAFVQNALSVGGHGDMLKSVYDTNDDGKVNKADDADKLGGQLPEYYAKVEDIPDISGKLDNSHNTDTAAHADIRELINSLDADIDEHKTDNTAHGIDNLNASNIQYDESYTIKGKIVSHLEDNTPHREAVSIERKNPDDDGIFTLIEFKRPDGTLFKTSQLNGISPYTSRTVKYYDKNENLVQTIEYSITYSNDEVVSEVIISA